MTTNIVPSNFVRFDSEGLELVVDTTTGKAYASISATARMLEISKSTVSAAFDNHETTEAQIEDPSGSKTVRLASSDVVFDLAFKYHPSLARKMGAAGANIYMLGLAGYKVAIKESKPQEPISTMQMISAMALQIDAQNKIAEAHAKELELIKAQQALEAARLDELAKVIWQHDSELDRVFNPNGHYFSVLGYARHRDIQIGIESAKVIGGKCSRHCKEHGIKIEKLADPRFGKVGSYPESVIAMFM